MNKKNITDILALTPMQEGMLFHYLKAPESDYYFEQLCLEIIGKIEVDAFENAWNYVIASNEMLRTLFRWEKVVRPVQIILKNHHIKPQYLDISGITDPVAEMEVIKNRDRHEKFNLQYVPFRITLCKIAEDNYTIIISNHHILYDGWSNSIILEEFFQAYNTLSNKKSLSLLPVKTNFKEFVKWNHGREIIHQEEYWELYLKGAVLPSQLAIKGTKIPSTIRKQHKIQCESTFMVTLEKFVKLQKTTAASILYTAWGILIQKYNNTNDAVFGTTVSGRSAPIKDIERIVGLFINTLPFRVHCPPDDTIKKLISGIDKSLRKRQKYENTSLVEIKKYCGMENNEELFDSIVVVENYPLDMNRLKNNSCLHIDSYSMFEVTHYDLTISITLNEPLAAEMADIMEISFIYDEQLFSPKTIDRLAKHYRRILETILTCPDMVVSDVDIITPDEKHQLLYTFSRSETFPVNITLPQLFEQQVAKTPFHTALTDTITSLTYQQLNEKAARLAALLHQKGIGPGTIAAIIVERSLEMIIAILAVLKAGGAYLPANPKNPVSRNRFLLQDSSAVLLLTHKDYGKHLQDICPVIHLEVEASYGLHPIETRSVDDASPTDFAYVIYTSGSTGNPKGVPITHSNICPLLHWGYKYMALSPSDRVIQNLSFFFDWSVWEIFISITSGSTLFMIDDNILLDPVAQADFMEKNRITVIHITPTQWQYILNTEKQISSLTHLAIGAEKLTYDVVRRSYERVDTQCRLYNMYGPTEATIMAAVLIIQRDHCRKHQQLSSVPIGSVISDSALYILDEHLKLCPVEVPGELFIAGYGVAPGYLNNPQLTIEKFITNPFLGDDGIQPPVKRLSMTNDKIYRTGDLCRWLDDGSIEFLGRIDHQVKIRGYRIEPGEIDKRLLDHQTIKDAIVTALTDNCGEPFLCAYIVPHHLAPTNENQWRDHLSHDLPDYMIPAYFIQLEKMPLNPNGKIDLKALPTPKLTASENYTAPRDDLEETLVEIWADLLEKEKHVISIDNNFFQLGGHSLKITGLSARIYKKLNVQLSVSELFQNPTIRDICSLVKQNRDNSQQKPIEPVEKREYYDLSSAQKRIYLQQKINEHTTAYNMTGCYRLKGIPDKETLQETFTQLVSRHESLRTSFPENADTVVQCIHESVTFEIEYRSDISDIQLNETIDQFICPFDLTHAPLMRVGLFKENDALHILVVDIHHIIADGISLGILIRDFNRLIDAKSLPPLTLHYKEYTRWQNHFLKERQSQSQEDYWINLFSGDIPIVELPLDYHRPTIHDFAGDTYAFEISKDESDELRQLADGQDATLFMLILSAFTLLLSRISKLDDIIIGTPVAGRSHADLEHIMGMFVNTLAFRNQIDGNLIFVDFLSTVRNNTLEALENQDYPFEKLVEKLGLDRTGIGNTLFNVMLTIDETASFDMIIPGLKVEFFNYQSPTAKFDLTLNVTTTPDLSFIFEYSNRIFKKETIQRFAAFLKNLIISVIQNPWQYIREMEIIPQEEKERILEEFNNTSHDYPINKNVIDLFVEQAERTPELIAVIFRDNRLTYRQLDYDTNQLAVLLLKKGVGCGTIVSIMVERSLEMVIGILAVLKTGGTYLPMDPHYPAERSSYILKDSSAGFLLTTSKVEPLQYRFPHSPPVILLDTNVETHLEVEYTAELRNISLSDTSYIIYTSGSTGTPKGVAVSRRSLSNLIYALEEMYPLSNTDAYLLKTAFLFDVSVTELFGWFSGGGRLVVLEPGDEKDSRKILETVYTHAVTHLNFVPSMFSVFLDQLALEDTQRLSSVKYIFVAGEALLPEMVETFRSFGTNIRLENLYGPTEGTVYASGYSLSKWSGGVVPIGHPLPNVGLYIVDQCRRLQPVGIAGELCISGTGLAQGYLNKPELTADHFITLDTQNRKDLDGVFRPTNPLPVYRTGDLARWRDDGNVEFLGRIDFQVKIRGYRIELGEIENSLLKHESISDAVVIAIDGPGGDKYLCAYYASTLSIIDPGLFADQIRGFLSGRLPDYMIPVHFVHLDQIPLTPSGKTNLKALPAPEIASRETYTAPRNGVEEILVGIWAQLLEKEKTCIGIDHNFFRMGGHSLKVTSLSSRIQKQLGVRLSIPELFQNPTIRDIAGLIDKKGRALPFEVIEPVEKREYYDSSSAQKRIYLQQQINQQSAAYNMTGCFRIKGETDRERFEYAFIQLINRHESLRTSFHLVGDSLVQIIHQQIPFAIEYHSNINETVLAETLGRFIRPFDLTRAPLLRVGLFQTGSDLYILIIDMHHIIADGVSLRLVLQDFKRLYEANPIISLKLQYKDFSRWQNQYFKEGHIHSQEEYWLNRFSSEVPVVELPLDYHRSTVQNFDGARYSFRISREESEALRRLAVDMDVTLFVLLQSVFIILVSRLSRLDDIVIGTPVAGRSHADLEHMIGMFVNTLALRNQVDGEITFRDFLFSVKNNTLDALENQDYPFEELVEQLKLDRYGSRNALFDVMFAIDDNASIGMNLPALEITPFIYESPTAKFDLTLDVVTEENFFFIFEYCTTLFKQETIERFSIFLKKLMTSIRKNPLQLIREMEIITAEEKKLILESFNNTFHHYSCEKSVIDLFTEQVALKPDRIAVTFRDSQLTYRQLNRDAIRLEKELLEKGAASGIIISIMVERSIEMITAVMAVMKTPAAYLPLALSYPLDRIQYMIENSRTGIMIIQKHLMDRVPVTFTGEIITIDQLYHKEETQTFVHQNKKMYTQSLSYGRPHDPVYVIFTSGSTGKPKGVVVQNRQYANAAYAWRDAYHLVDIDVRLLQIASFSFDVFSGDIARALCNGGTLVVCPEETRLDMEHLYHLIRDQYINLFESTPALIVPLMEYIHENRLKIDNLELVILGSDILTIEEYNKLNSLFGDDIKFLNSYGVTEATIDTSFYEGELTAIPLSGNVPIGKPMANMRFYILDEGGNLLPIGISGELYIGGAGVAKGYLNNNDLTNERFLQDPFFPSERMYKTGDLARWLKDGNVEFLGRVDSQVKIRGYRIELGEIENILLKHKGVREAVVIACDAPGGSKFLCAYYIQDSTSTYHDEPESDFYAFLSTHLPDYMIPTHFVPLEKIPLTPNGKVDRKGLPMPKLKEIPLHIAPRDEVENKLAKIWADLLKVEKDQISIDSNFFKCGGHSLTTIAQVSRIQKTFNVKIPFAEIFDMPTLKELATYIKKAIQERFVSITPIEKKEYYILSAAQKRLYILQQMAETSTAYNMTGLFHIEGIMDMEKIRETFHQLIHRHESLRTSFQRIGDDIYQIINENLPFQLEFYRPSEFKTKESIELQSTTFVRPFNLECAPLLRVGILPEENDRHFLMVDLHHIIADELSLDIIVRDFAELYKGSYLSPMLIQYKDFAHWQTIFFQSEELNEQSKYWQNILKEELPIVNLPLDYPRPPSQSFRGSTLNFHLSREDCQSFKALALEVGATFFMVLLTIFYILISKLTGQEDIVIGTPVAGRRHADLESVVGMFVNTLVLRSSPVGEKNFCQFLQEVKVNSVEAFSRQDYPFDKLVDTLSIKREAGRNPIIDVMFVLQGSDISKIQLPGMALSAIDYEVQNSRFDLTLTALEMAGCSDNLLLTFNYCTDIFKRNTIQRFAVYFREIAAAVLKDQRIKLKRIPIITRQERKQVVEVFNRTEAPFPKEPLPLLWKKQVNRTPDHIAVVETSSTVMGYSGTTYRELDIRAGRLASFLAGKGIGRGHIVAVMAEPSSEMIAGLLGILETGSAYLPIDPNYPLERVKYMLNDSNAAIFLTGVDKDIPIFLETEMISLESCISNNIFPSFPTESMILQSVDPAYVIYTSGTTGKPKGVIIEQKSVANVITRFARAYNIVTGTRVVMMSDFTFDASVDQIFGTLFHGGSLYLVDKELRLDIDGLRQYLSKTGVEIINFVPMLLKELLGNKKKIESLNIVISGADSLEETTKDIILHQGYRLFNHYGPTEATIHALAAECSLQRNVDLGPPIDNTQCYILDKYLEPLPIGIPGQLYISGAGVARGYLNRPQLTHDSFGPDPFRLGRRMYRTGDRVRWLQDGRVVFLGRMDYQVKIRGFRVEIGEIENRLISYRGIKESVVVAREHRSGDKYLCTYIVSEKDITLEYSHLQEYLRQELPEYMIPSYFIPMERLPLNDNGKIQRSALPEPEIKNRAVSISASDPIESALVDIWAEALGHKKNEICVTDNFFKLGGHSLKATKVVSMVYKILGVKMSLAEIFKRQTIQSLAQFIKTSASERFTTIDITEKREYYPLSSAQRRLYILQQMEPHSTAYNMPHFLILRGIIDRERLDLTFKKLIHRHESLRTFFIMVDSEPVQVIGETAAIETRTYNIGNSDIVDKILDEFVQPFDLTVTPLIRLGLVMAGTNKNILMMDMHHIITDGISVDIFIHEFKSIYTEKILPPIKLQYRDFAIWQNQWLESSQVKKQEAFWLDLFKDGVPLLKIPTDFPRPMHHSEAGTRESFQTGRQRSEELQELALKEGTSMHMMLTACFALMLSKMSGQEDIVVGTASAGRSHPDLDYVIGFFLNMMAVRYQVKANSSFRDFLYQAKECNLAAYSNRDYQFETLVEKLQVERKVNRHPIFDVMFGMQDLDTTEMTLPGVKIESYPHEIPISRVDITVLAMAINGQLELSFEYRTDLFKQETIQRYFTYYCRILDTVIQNPDILIKDIELISEEEKNRFLTKKMEDKDALDIDFDL